MEEVWLVNHHDHGGPGPTDLWPGSSRRTSAAFPTETRRRPLGQPPGGPGPGLDVVSKPEDAVSRALLDDGVREVWITAPVGADGLVRAESEQGRHFVRVD